MAGFLETIANGVRDSLSTHEDNQARENCKSACEMLKVVAVVATIVNAMIFIAVPTAFSACGLAATIFISREAIYLATNVLEVLESAITEVLFFSNRANLINQLAKNTFTIRSIDRIFQPDWTRLLPA